MKNRPLVLSAFVFIALAIAVLAGIGTGASFETAGELWSRPDRPVIEITAVDYAFAVDDPVPSGWMTLQMTNKGEDDHHLPLFRLPEGRTFSEFRRARIAPMDSIRRLVWEGAADSSELAKVEENIPEWADLGNFHDAGGVAVISPGQTGRTTVKLTPGHYAMVCFLRDSTGRRHYQRGMIRGLRVTEEASGASPPEADVTMRTSGGEVNVEGTFRTGEQTVALEVGPPPKGSEGPYQFAILGRMNATGSPPEAIHTWLGGPENVPQGETGYARIDLTPGRYAWVFFHPAKENLTRAFTVK